MKHYKLYIGVRLTRATPMSRLSYYKYRGFRTGRDDERMSDEEGYLVVHPDGYEGWSPKDDFEKAYQEANIPKEWVDQYLKGE